MGGTAFDLRAIKNFDSRLEKLDKCRKICKLSMQEYESGYIYIYIYIFQNFIRIGTQNLEPKEGTVRIAKYCERA